MAKYSYYSKNSTEAVSSIDAPSLNEAVDFFSKLKVLPKTKFLELYEVNKREDKKDFKTNY
jgi:hypothetical protein